jgi:hypothetical protein
MVFVNEILDTLVVCIVGVQYFLVSQSSRLSVVVDDSGFCGNMPETALFGRLVIRLLRGLVRTGGVTLLAVGLVHCTERRAARLVASVTTKAVLQRLGSLRPQLIVAIRATALLVFDMLGVEKRRRPLFGGKHNLFERLVILGRYNSQSNQRDGGENCNYVLHKNPPNKRCTNKSM